MNLFKRIWLLYKAEKNYVPEESDPINEKIKKAFELNALIDVENQKVQSEDEMIETLITMKKDFFPNLNQHQIANIVKGTKQITNNLSGTQEAIERHIILSLQQNPEGWKTTYHEENGASKIEATAQYYKIKERKERKDISTFSSNEIYLRAINDSLELALFEIDIKIDASYSGIEYLHRQITIRFKNHSWSTNNKMKILNAVMPVARKRQSDILNKDFNNVLIELNP